MTMKYLLFIVSVCMGVCVRVQREKEITYSINEWNLFKSISKLNIKTETELRKIHNYQFSKILLILPTFKKISTTVLV